MKAKDNLDHKINKTNVQYFFTIYLLKNKNMFNIDYNRNSIFLTVIYLLVIVAKV